jgi:N-acetylneuraminic acid mutarotase
VGGKVGIDATKASWQKVSKKGHFPTKRCGAVMTIYKNKAILFGGVLDEERDRHTMLSTFYNDLYAFDMERKRWYQLGLRIPKTKSTVVIASYPTSVQ